MLITDNIYKNGSSAMTLVQNTTKNSEGSIHQKRRV